MNENIRIIFGILIILLIYLNITNTVHKNKFENFSTELDENKSILDKYLEYNKKIYEYIFNKKIPDKINTSNNFKPITFTDYYNNINKTIKEYYNENKSYNECGYVYKYYDEESLLPGSMYLTDDEIIININDLNNNNIISVIENNITLVISNKLITYQYDIENFNVDVSKGIITIYIDQNKNDDSFFNTDNQYILYPCSSNVFEHIENTNTNFVKTYISNNNIGRTITYFLCLFFIVFLIYNWKFLYYTFNDYLSRKTDTDINDDDELSYIYKGGYDYKDYSE
jgi:hypothetical protein